MPAVRHEFLCEGQNGKISKQDEKIGDFLCSVTEIRAHGLQFLSCRSQLEWSPDLCDLSKRSRNVWSEQDLLLKKYDE